jgi:hypothetical protein
MMKNVLAIGITVVTTAFSSAVFTFAFFSDKALGAAITDEQILKTEINLLLQSVIVKNDFLLLGSQLPFDPNSVLSYSSTTDDQGWTGTLTGTYAGLPINVTYNGALIGDPDLAFDSQGTVGADVWSGKGNGNVQLGQKDPIKNTVGVTINPFQQQLGVTGTVSNGLVSASLSAVKDFDGDERRKEGFLRLEAAIGLLSVKGVLPALAEGAYNFDLFQTSLDYEDAVETRVLFGLWNTRKVVSSGTFSTPVVIDPGTGQPVSNLPITNNVTFRPASVPEPTSTLSLLVLGTLGTASALKRKQNQKSTEKETTKVG